jgi:hypothetical protein
MTPGGAREDSNCNGAGSRGETAITVDPDVIRCEMQACSSNCNGLCLAGTVNIGVSGECERYPGPVSKKCPLYRRSTMKFCMAGGCAFNAGMKCAAWAITVADNNGRAVCGTFAARCLEQKT